MQKEMAERQNRITDRSKQIKKFQQQDLQNRKELPTPLTELEKKQIVEKKKVFAEKNEAVEVTNRALNSVKQTMVDLKIQTKVNIPKLSGRVWKQFLFF